MAFFISRYDDDMTVNAAYTVCNADEGDGCSDSAPDVSMDVSGMILYFDKYLFQDHHFYFNTGYIFAMLGCPGYNPNP